MRLMRAKMRVNSVERFEFAEKLNLSAVARSGGYPDDGSDEDNTYAKFSPTGELTLTVVNPELIGKFAPGQRFYLDFTPAD